VTVFEFLDYLFPANDYFDVPAFSGCENFSLAIFADEIVDDFSDLIRSTELVLGEADVNTDLRALRRLNPLLLEEILSKALEVYFSSPDVTTKITTTPSPLFPSQRVLPDINFELLIPVVDLGNAV